MRIAVIGAGHAGCEAAYASARLGFHTTLFAISMDSVAVMPCNPCVGGSAKGHLVKEVDALGGLMGKVADACYLQSRTLNTAKGPAVYSLRVQTDKKRYSDTMKRLLESEPNIALRQNEIVEIIAEEGRVAGVRAESGDFIRFDAVVVCSGTYMEARCLYGETVIRTGPNGFRPSAGLSGNLRELGFEMMRFKTGTPARVSKRSVDFSKMEIQRGDEPPSLFSFESDPGLFTREQLPCYLTYTNERTHELIRSGIFRSPMYSGKIEGTGTRYCPSIEDKVMRFPDKLRHPVFIEPEGEHSGEMYVQGMSSSLPEDMQIAAYRTIPGLEECEFVRNAYAIEYDCIDATKLKLSLEAKHIRGLFFAGQVNGSSGYEEAAAQGIIAGINAALFLSGREPFILGRSEAYIGVLIDDLVTKGSREPYRMMTSRAEYRLLLRQDNADERLTEKGYEAGLIPIKRYEDYLAKKDFIEREIERVLRANIPPSREVNEILALNESPEITTGCKLSELIKRPELSYAKLEAADSGRPSKPGRLKRYVFEAAREQVNIRIKYEGYVRMQSEQAEASLKLESKLIPSDLDYESLGGLRIEARQKLTAIRPENIGQASRITGVSPADIQVLLVYMRSKGGK